MHPKTAKNPKGSGRTTTLTPEIAARIFYLSRRGHTHAEIGFVLRIRPTMVMHWQRDPSFFKFIHQNKALADKLVERSLYERAMGYEYQTQEVIKGEVVEVQHRIPPDVVACIFWLKNRQRNNWRDRHELDQSGKVDVHHQFYTEIIRRSQQPTALDVPPVPLPQGNGQSNGNGHAPA